MSTRLPVVALHGFTGSGSDFDLLRAMRTRFAWHTPDLPGHGAALGTDAGFSLPAIAQGIAARLERLPRPRLLLGYSMGGRIALHTAVQHPGCADGLVLIGASPGIADARARAERADLDRARAARVRELGAARFGAEWARVPLIATQDTIAEPFRSAMRARRAAADGEGWARSLELTGTGTMEPLHDRLDGLRIPVMLIVGETDSKFRAIAEEMAIRLPRGCVGIIEGAGHAAHLEQPARFAGVLEDWADDVMGDR